MNTDTSRLAGVALASLLALSACNTEPETLNYNADDPADAALVNAAPLDIPPMIQASRIYRCKDNSLIYTDFFTDNSVRVRTERGVGGTRLNAPGPDQPYVAEGYSLSANADVISYTAPGKGTQSCRA